MRIKPNAPTTEKKMITSTAITRESDERKRKRTQTFASILVFWMAVDGKGCVGVVLVEKSAVQAVVVHRPLTNNRVRIWLWLIKLNSHSDVSLRESKLGGSFLILLFVIDLESFVRKRRKEKK